MHPRNELRLLAGLTIDQNLEKSPQKQQINEARTASVKTPKSVTAVTEHAVGIKRAITHIKSAVNALKQIPGRDSVDDVSHYIYEMEAILGNNNEGLTQLFDSFNQELASDSAEIVTEDHFKKGTILLDKKGKCWEVVSSKGEGNDEKYSLKCPKSGDKTEKKYSEIKDWEESSKEKIDEMMRYEREEQAERSEKFDTAADFKKGEKVMYDNGIWVVHIADAKADLVGIIPPSIQGASEEEKAKAMQQVKRDKIRKPSEEECEVMAGSYAMESTHNYTKSNSETHDEDEENPVNVVGQAEKQWANSLNPEYVKDEFTSQLDQRGDQSMDDYVNKVKVPAKVKTALRTAISEFEKDAKKFGGAGTDSEARVFHVDAANAFRELLGYLDMGNIQGIKKAQVFASSLMGPMLHKLPKEVWDFVTHGGQKRSLKDYMSPVDKKFPITGPRNSE